MRIEYNEYNDSDLYRKSFQMSGTNFTLHVAGVKL